MGEASFCALLNCAPGLRAVDFSSIAFDECVCADAARLVQGTALFRSHGHFLSLAYVDGVRDLSLATSLAGSLTPLCVVLGYGVFLAFARRSALVATAACVVGWLGAGVLTACVALAWQALAPFGGWGSWQSEVLELGFVAAALSTPVWLGALTRTLRWVLTLHAVLVGAVLMRVLLASIPLVAAHATLASTPERLTVEQVRAADGVRSSD